MKIGRPSTFQYALLQDFLLSVDLRGFPAEVISVCISMPETSVTPIRLGALKIFGVLVIICNYF